MQTNWVDKILDCAIINEERAADFYRYLANLARKEAMKKVFLGLALEEESHKARLLDVKAGQQALTFGKSIPDLGLAEQLDEEPIDLAGKMDYPQALVIAMKSEKEAFKLYTSLAEATTDASCKAILQGLAQEEAMHKLRFEVEYDEHMLKEN
ncbi:MAG: ferritin family protein [Planctomycetota bacterium]